MLLLPISSDYSPWTGKVVTDFNLPLQIVVDLEYYGLGTTTYFGFPEYNGLDSALLRKDKWFNLTHELYRCVDYGEGETVTNTVVFNIDDWALHHEHKRHV